MTGVHIKLPNEVATLSKSEEDSMPYLPLDQPVPTYVLGRRRHAISNGAGADLPYRSKPRMKRRGAVSYQTEDATAQYIRYLGMLCQKPRKSP